LSTNIKTIAICSFTNSSRASSTVTQSFALPISSQIATFTLVEKLCKISFYTIVDVEAFFGALAIASTIYSLYKTIKFNILRNFPHFVEPTLPSRPLKATS